MERLYGTFCGQECSTCEAKIGLCLVMSRGNWCLYRILKPSGALRPGQPPSRSIPSGWNNWSLVSSALGTDPLLCATTYIIAEIGAKHWYDQDPQRRFVIADPSVITKPDGPN